MKDFIVYTGGTFDVLHPGHLDLLAVCRAIAGNNGEVVVGLNRDEFVTRFKGKPPVCTYAERECMLNGCRYVTRVVKNSGDENSKIILNEVKPSFLVIGDDWATRDYYLQMGITREWLIQRGCALIYVARLRPLSSTEIKARVNG